MNTTTEEVSPHNNKFRIFLREELEKRIERNPKFSLRAFARMLNVEPSSLSQILNAKRKLTDSMCLRLGKMLDLSPHEFNSLMDRKLDDKNRRASTYDSLSPEHFNVIADWYHYAILELTHLDGFIPTAQFVAKVLKISIPQVQSAVERLCRLGYMRIKNEQWIDQSGDVTTMGNPYTTPAFRKLQTHVLQKAIDAMEEIPYELRSQTSMTLPVSLERLEEAKEKIHKFRRELSDFLREGSSKDEVYHLSLSLYPVSDLSEQRTLS